MYIIIYFPASPLSIGLSTTVKGCKWELKNYIKWMWSIRWYFYSPPTRMLDIILKRFLSVKTDVYFSTYLELENKSIYKRPSSISK